MSINKKIIIAALAGIVFGVSSCKKFLNVNQNPNGAQTATLKTLLPAAELLVGSAQGVDLEIDGSFFAQYWTQSPGASQYHNLDQYAPSQDAFSNPWTNLYAAAENFYQLYKLADSQKAHNYMAISLLMRAYTFQLITDGWGSAPFSQALKGQYADGHLVNPSYDQQDSIYMGIIAMIDSANALIDLTSPTYPKSDDLIYGKVAAASGMNVMTYWQEFANTLALRVYMRMSAINPGAAQAGIAALYATSPVFIGTNAGDDAFIAYGTSSANENPLYAEEVGLGFVQNIVGSGSCLDTMLVEGDPRINIFYEPVTPGGTNFVGLPQGLYAVAYTGYSYPSFVVAADAQNTQSTGGYTSGNAPVNFITSYESLFLQAEAAARGWSGVAAGTDATLFQQAIAANFNYYSGQFTAITGSSGATQYTNYMAANSYWTQYPTGGTTQQKVQYIITQKYFSMCGNQGFEAWTEWRRTGYPNWFVISVSSITGNPSTYNAATGVYTPSYYNSSTPYPKRFYYPSSESTVNSSFPGLQPLTSKVWWDVL